MGNLNKTDQVIANFDTPKATFFAANFSKSLKSFVTNSGKRAVQNEYNI